jgi:TonB family protein
MKLMLTWRMVMLLLVSSASNIFSAGEAVALYAPRPAYSPKWPEGRGVFVLHLDTRTGKVVSVSVAKSTGATILDQSAVAGLKQWRFRPGPKAVRIPFEFTHRPESDFLRSSRGQ